MPGSRLTTCDASTQRLPPRDGGTVAELPPAHGQPGLKVLTVGGAAPDKAGYPLVSR